MFTVPLLQLARSRLSGNLKMLTINTRRPGRTNFVRRARFPNLTSDPKCTSLTSRQEQIETLPLNNTVKLIAIYRIV